MKKEVSKKFKLRVDVGYNGIFEIAVKNFSWVLPEKAYVRAIKILKYSNLEVMALHPLDIVVLKCDRLNESDQEDIRLIFENLKPCKNELVGVFEEYYALLEGNPASIENIRENFYQLALTIYEISMKKQFST